MKQVEISAPTVEQAVEAALKQLKAQKSQVEVSVISEGGGFLGGDALVRVSLLEEGESPSYFDEYNSSEPAFEAEDDLKPVHENTASAGNAGSISAECVSITKEVISELLNKMDFGHARVEVVSGKFVMPGEDAEISTVFNIRGEGLGSLIGRKNQTLVSLQYIVRLMVSGKADCYVPVILDVNGARQKRFRELKGLALRMADQVTAKKMPFALEPMSAFDRRIVHMVLSDHPMVTTQSVGQGDGRKIIVLLRD